MIQEEEPTIAPPFFTAEDAEETLTHPFFNHRGTENTKPFTTLLIFVIQEEEPTIAPFIFINHRDTPVRSVPPYGARNSSPHIPSIYSQILE
ncbi:hypothetical protein KAW18_14545 [candidate division WOR-3 bacterium]|nr:hypothetical protein [candidate division WOR-3 bacterium]